MGFPILVRWYLYIESGPGCWAGNKPLSVNQWRPSSKTPHSITRPQGVNTLRLRHNGHHFPDDIFKCIFLTENVWIAITISLKLVPEGPINNIPALVQIMAWCRPGDKPLSEPIMVKFPTNICITRPQWVNPLHAELFRGNINVSTIYTIVPHWYTDRQLKSCLM